MSNLSTQKEVTVKPPESAWTLHELQSLNQVLAPLDRKTQAHCRQQIDPSMNARFTETNAYNLEETSEFPASQSNEGRAV